jgi:hypothetical protein
VFRGIKNSLCETAYAPTILPRLIDLSNGGTHLENGLEIVRRMLRNASSLPVSLCCPQTVLFEASQDALSGKQNLNDSTVQEIGILGKEGILGKRQCDLLCLTWAKFVAN